MSNMNRYKTDDWLSKRSLSLSLDLSRSLYDLNRGEKTYPILEIRDTRGVGASILSGLAIR